MEAFSEKGLIEVLCQSLRKNGIDPDEISTPMFDKLKGYLRNEMYHRYGKYVNFKQYDMSCFKVERR